jgi:hypothetical protein
MAPKKVTMLGIDVKKDENYPEWYTQVNKSRLISVFVF